MKVEMTVLRLATLVLPLMVEHEWELTDDRRHVVCSTCGQKHLDKSANRTHREYCDYAATLRLLRELGSG